MLIDSLSFFISAVGPVSYEEIHFEFANEIPKMTLRKNVHTQNRYCYNLSKYNTDTLSTVTHFDLSPHLHDVPSKLAETVVS